MSTRSQVGLLNVDGFYDPLLSFIDMAVNEGFIKEDARRIVISAPTAKELVLKLEVCVCGSFRSRFRYSRLFRLCRRSRRTFADVRV